jgi:hypothetical protein
MRARPLFRMLAVALVGGVLLAPPARAGADANPPPWDVTATPNQGAGANTLHGVTALSPTEAWAVGRFVTPSGKAARWSSAGTGRPGLSRPAEPGTDRRRPARGGRWRFSHRRAAVGSARLTSGVTRTLIEHWDGSVWTIVSSPNGGSPADSTMSWPCPPRRPGRWGRVDRLPDPAVERIGLERGGQSLPLPAVRAHRRHCD